MQSVASLVPDSVTRILKHGYSQVTGLDNKWKTGLIVIGTTGTVVTGTYLLYRYTSSSSSSSDASSMKRDHRNGSAHGVYLSRKSSTPKPGPAHRNHLSLPVTSRARTALEFEDVTDDVRRLVEVDGGFLSTCITTGGSPVYPRRRNDSLTSGTTTLMISSSRTPSELLLYGLESLKRSIRLFDEARNKLVMDEDKDHGSYSRENSTDSELEFILCKARQLQDDIDSYLRETFPEEVTLIADRTVSQTQNQQQVTDGHSHNNNLNHNLSSPMSTRNSTIRSVIRSPSNLSRHGSNASLATTITMPFFDIEPNLHFFKLYTNALDNYMNILEPRSDRSKQLMCETHEEFLAKVHCIRNGFGEILEEDENREYFSQLGKEILEIVLSHSPKDPTACMIAYQDMLVFVSDPGNKEAILSEIAVRNIPSNSFYDLVLDYMILESFDDLENPPSAVTSVANNRWLSSGFRELALQTAVSAVLKHKRSKLPIKGGFFEHFYNILEHVSPILAWGFLGSDIELKFKCNLIRDAILRLSRSFFSFDKVRYTSLTDLQEDVLRITDEEYENLRKQLNCNGRTAK